MMRSNSVRTRLLGVVLFMTTLTASAGWFDALKSPTSLPEVETRVEVEFPDVRQLSPDDLAERLRRDAPIVLLDVRAPEEFAVSHLANARRIDPSASDRDVRQTIGPSIRDAQIVMYCSVGYRSSKLASRVRESMLANGAASVENLRGGIFAWSNRGMPLVDAQGPTRQVHPFNSRWGVLLNQVPPKTVVPQP